MSTDLAWPSRTSSAMDIPTMAASLKPWPLKPTAQYRPEIPSTRSRMGCQSGVMVNSPDQPPWNPPSDMAGIRCTSLVVYSSTMSKSHALVVGIRVCRVFPASNQSQVH